jgi:hypothetical protein
MRDRYFFPLAATLAAAFVLMALQPFVDRPPRGPASGGGRNAEDITIEGRELHRFVPGNFDGTAIVTPPEGGAPILRITQLADQTYEDPKSGPNLPLAEDLEYAFESRPIEIVIEARSVGDFAASQFEANYWAKPEGESGWKKFDLTPEFKPYPFTYEAPPRGDAAGNDFLAIRPVAPDKRRVMEVRSVRIHTVGPKKAAPGPGTSVIPPS